MTSREAMIALRTELLKEMAAMCTELRDELDVRFREHKKDRQAETGQVDQRLTTFLIQYAKACSEAEAATAQRDRIAARQMSHLRRWIWLALAWSLVALIGSWILPHL